MSERRVYERIKAAIEVSLSSEHNFYTGFTSDISEGGVFIAGVEILPLGSLIDFDLKLGKGMVSVRGVVRWIREPTKYTEDVPPGMGVEFVDLPPAVGAKINEFIDSHRESIFFENE